MRFKPEEFNAKTQEILANLTDQAKVSTLLAELTEHNTEINTENAKALETSTKLSSDNEKLRQANMDLFLKIGTEKKVEEKKVEEDNTPKYESLFDENGKLK